MTNTLQQPGHLTNRPELAETAPLMLCAACGAEARTRDRFCRRCGALLIGEADSASRFGTSPFALPTPGSRPAAIIEMAEMAEMAAPQRASGALLASVASGVSASLRVCPIHPAIRRLLIALISIPIWMLIVLLSPLDAYATARGISKLT